MKLGGQLRVGGGLSAMIIGWDMNAALALGDALGVDRTAVAEFLPDVESVAVKKMNEGLQENDG